LYLGVTAGVPADGRNPSEIVGFIRISERRRAVRNEPGRIARASRTAA